MNAALFAEITLMAEGLRPDVQEGIEDVLDGHDLVFAGAALVPRTDDDDDSDWEDTDILTLWYAPAGICPLASTEERLILRLPGETFGERAAALLENMRRKRAVREAAALEVS